MCFDGILCMTERGKALCDNAFSLFRPLIIPHSSRVIDRPRALKQSVGGQSRPKGRFALD